MMRNRVIRPNWEHIVLAVEIRCMQKFKLPQLQTLYLIWLCYIALSSIKCVCFSVHRFGNHLLLRMLEKSLISHIEEPLKVSFCNLFVHTQNLASCLLMDINNQPTTAHLGTGNVGFSYTCCDIGFIEDYIELFNVLKSRLASSYSVSLTILSLLSFPPTLSQPHYIHLLDTEVLEQFTMSPAGEQERVRKLSISIVESICLLKPLASLF